MQLPYHTLPLGSLWRSDGAVNDDVPDVYFLLGVLVAEALRKASKGGLDGSKGAKILSSAETTTVVAATSESRRIGVVAHYFPALFSSLAR